ncbi:sensor histidine kinase [Haloarcula nitratireducens]|uniref:histidine kinase n=1 Tax=Haloarcula nitratireducens TaxID=2487749 RepID=A0AAW4PI80_9EURY|nr:GAF domain-containing sensor histidine kinase [Halomicroarcula nitratireducens]MBX0297457.1 GAF domain-containing sensor histidine kinase [Halomicroarcula nitratireducens]
MGSPSGGDTELQARIRQQEVITDLGQQALEDDDLDRLMHDASVAVADTLGNDYCKALELLPSGDELFLRQGVGWQDGLVGDATVPTDVDSQAGYTLISEEPIVVDDLRTEDRFSGPDLLVEHDVVSGISVIIGTVDEPWGILGTHTTERREFTEYDVKFVQSVSNLLAAAIERHEYQNKLETTVAKLQESNTRLESFASMLAHELRNPVTIGQIYSHQLPTEVAPEAVEYVTEAFDRIEDMVDVMLVLTKGRDAVGERNPLSLADVVQAAWDEGATPEATLDLELDGVIRADETYLRHLFRNLFENAVQHGGGDVTVEVGKLDNGFYVADDGTGIPAAHRDVVFDTGFTTAGDEGGTGLGLAFVRELAAVYEWTTTVTESTAGGARFEFRDVDFRASD